MKRALTFVLWFTLNTLVLASLYNRTTSLRMSGLSEKPAPAAQVSRCRWLTERGV
jgi:hypothetical protein